MNKALDWAYLAGFVDADGSIVVNRWLDNRYQRHRYITRICISNCDRQIMNWLVSEFGGSVSMANRNAPKTTEHFGVGHLVDSRRALSCATFFLTYA